MQAAKAPVILYDHLDRPIELPAMSLQGSFRNSTRERTRSGKRGPIGSVNAHHDSRSLQNLIRDCTQLARDNDLARGILGARIDHVVGEQITLEARSDDEAWNREAEARFAEWAEGGCDHTGQMTLTELAAAVVHSWDIAGGIVAHKVNAPGGACRVELIDAIRLMNKAGTSNDTRLMHGGVEMNEDGRPVAYWIADWNDQGTSLVHTPKRHAANHMWLINNPRFQGPGQVRCHPRLVAVIDQLEALMTARRSAIGAYQLATFIALLFMRDNPEGLTTREALGQAMVQQGLASTVEEALQRGEWGPATTMDLLPGERVEQVKPEHPSTAFDQVMWSELMVLAADMGLPLELTHMRFIRNYSASRSAIAVAWKKIRADQQALVRRFLKPVYRWFIANEMQSRGLRKLRREQYSRCEFIMPSMPVLDPKAEAEGVGLELSQGTLLHEQALRHLGRGDRREFLRKFTIEQEQNEVAGLSYGKPVQVTRSEQVNPEDEHTDA